jgi:ribosomal protein S27AE
MMMTSYQTEGVPAMNLEDFVCPNCGAESPVIYEICENVTVYAEVSYADEDYIETGDLYIFEDGKDETKPKYTCSACGHLLALGYDAFKALFKPENTADSQH